MFTDSSRNFISAIALALAISTGFSASAQQGAFQYVWADRAPSDAITGADIREALIWTGSLQPMALGESDGARKALQTWQAARRYPTSDQPTPDQAAELVYDGLRIRDSFGWAILRDDSVGFAVGIPTKLTKFDTPRNEGGAFWYRSQGAVAYSIGVKYGNASCNNLPRVQQMLKRASSMLVRQGNAVIALGKSGDRVSMVKAICQPAGLVVSEIEMLESDLAARGVLLAAMVNSFGARSTFDPTAPPKPRVVALPPAPSSLPSNEPARVETAAANLPPGVDPSGTVANLGIAKREGADLRPDEVFEKASGAVYLVKADNRQGSAVAVGEHDLLTNCHVVGSRSRVTLRREKKEIEARVVSMNPAADRCVLRTETKLPHWVGVRPYDDVKVGERALSIGTPFGLELTLADGVVSSKRIHKAAKLIQTSAPISQGSSGGGLFDARGNLIGITTFQVRLGQNLNFALAAEDYAKVSN